MERVRGPDGRFVARREGGVPELEIGRHARGGKAAPILRKQRAGTWTRDKRERYLAELEQTANIAAACRAVGMGASGLRAPLKRDSLFKAAHEDALSEAYAALEAELFNRAMHGEEKPVIRGGEVVDRIRTYPDSLAIRLLEAHRDSVERRREIQAIESIDVVRERIERKLDLLMKKYGGPE